MRRAVLILAGVLALVYVAATGLYVVDHGGAALVTQLGKPVRVVEEPGLHFKMPAPVQSVQAFDRRLRVWDSEPIECATADSAAVVLSVYAAWRVGDTRAFAAECGTPERAERRIADAVRSSLAAAVAREPMGALASTVGSDIRTPSVLATVRRECAAAVEGMGIEIAEVALTGMTLPAAAREAVVRRMSAEQEAAAALELAAGEEEAARIRAAADSERVAILNDARLAAERIRTEADAEALGVLAAAHAADPEFYRFVRTLDAYRAFMDGRTTVVLSTDSPLLRLLERKE
ncbi:MAG: hypothetical protein FJY74_04865 [Candidatus Eisenbacteria bacterium]|nr:hypothetical protein [Candidatus Eisenbacteria bacterium]